MSYYFAKKLSVSFEEAKALVTEKLKEQGFGVLTEIDMKATMKKKLNEDISDYTILGACNPAAAFKSLKAEERIGLMLPCNVIVRRISDDKVEVAAVDPVASMMAIKNLDLGDTAHDIQAKLKSVIENL
jgi:uncharacterized protein (DUF302 family)